MDDELLKLEAELKQLRPSAPSSWLREEIARELTPTKSRAAAFFLVPLAAAAALILAFNLNREPAAKATRPTTLVSAASPNSASSTASSSSASHHAKTAKPFQPVAAENVLVASSDEGLVTLADGTPARQLRQTYVDTITWKDSRTNASLKWSMPREEVRVVPIALQ
ncbi:MAG TPA: hypothetical protein VFT72_17315 [Opitutaceae bacterium]|nr:hypothetical protein [Opitutaceae bacterium]